MHKFRRLFVSLDFSVSSDEALREAHVYAAAEGAQLAVCHIVPNHLRSNMLFPQVTQVAALKIPLAMNDVAQAVTKRVLGVTGRSEGTFDLIVDDGTPQALILSYAEEWKADIIFMGSYGETHAADELLGSVTSSVLRHAHCPVMIVRPGPRSRRIIAGTDFSDVSTMAIRIAANEAERSGSELTVVHSLDLIWSPASYPAMAFGGAPFEVSPSQIQELESLAQGHLDETLKTLHVTADTLVITGAAGSALVEIAAEKDARLIVVGTVGRTGMRRALLGSVAEAVAKSAPCPVLVVRGEN